MTNSKILAVLAIVLLELLNHAAHAYDMPTGIPVPDFGSALGNPVTTPLPAHPSAWPGREAAGYYYIDNTAATATNSDNPYGYPNRPRESIPKSLPAGSVVEVRGGPYEYATDAIFILDGTATRPVFLYGINHPVLNPNNKVSISGSYFVFDGFDLRDSSIQSLETPYAVIRNNDVQGNAGTPTGLKISGGNILVYNNAVHHHQGDDTHGINIREGSHDIWILGNQLHHNGGDGIQFCHGCVQNPPRNVYIGGNTIYGNRENGVDLKYCNNVVISRNKIYNHWPSAAGVSFCYDDGSGCTTGSSGGDGESILVGSAGTPNNIWVLFNEVYDSNMGIVIQDGFDVFVLGNVVHDVQSFGIRFLVINKGPVTAAFNTIYNTATGIEGPWENVVLSITMDDNILSRISGDSVVIRSGAAAFSSASNNLFYNDGGNISMTWRSHAVLSSGSAVNSMTGGSGNLVGNPMFRNPSASDFHVMDSGTGVNQANGRLVTLNNQYRSTFGNQVSILRDFDNAPRSYSGTDDDIGAYESSNTGGIAPPLPPVIN